MTPLTLVPPLRTICAWCSRVIHDTPAQVAAKVSHGICWTCAQRLLEEDRSPR